MEKKQKIKNFLEMTKEIISNIPKITIVGSNEMLIENYKGILEYEEFFVRVNTYIGIINVNGLNLNLNQITEDDMIITGKIDSIDIEEDK